MTNYASAVPPTPAPWAEIVPGMGPVTVDILLTIPDDGYVYEVVDGVLVRMAGSGKAATRIGLRLGAALITYVEEHGLGIVTGADGVYKFPSAETGLIPDVGFYTAERDATIPESDDNKPIPFAPDLAVEVVSPSQDADDMPPRYASTSTAGRALSGSCGRRVSTSMSGVEVTHNHRRCWAWPIR